MILTDFFLKWNNKFCDIDLAYGAECVDLVKAYYKDVLGLAPISGNAIDYWKDMPGFKKIPNTLGIYPLPGDIVIWNTPPYGHIAICNYTTWTKLGVFEQNNPLGSPCHYGEHSYKGIVGWLRPPLKDVMRYTCFNADPALMEQARQLMLQYTNGKIDAVFQYLTDSQPHSGIFTQDQQAQFVKTHTIATPFIFYFYDAGLSNYAQIATAQVLGSRKVMSAATPFTQTPLNVCYEFANGLCKLLNVPGDDIYTPTEEFVKKRFAQLLVILEGGVSI